ncbi:cupin domain-containing protein [Nakamurella aerolata]|uniref:Cupin domain-containing protein n=1 Tax=Nakamurella aerolata TaxID=1656892 RepID=A0A849A8N2_9ACTN|nr:cupin domain-containing protein [Nakamurella aerolata]
MRIQHLVAPDSEAAPRRMVSDGPAAMVVAEFDAGGTIGQHPATGSQLFMVVTGTVVVTAGDGETAELTPGSAVLFFGGEEHTSTAAEPSTVAILEWPAE